MGLNQSALSSLVSWQVKSLSSIKYNGMKAESMKRRSAPEPNLAQASFFKNILSVMQEKKVLLLSNV
nr:hypothetical protein [uncultured Acetatifactor sp.]